MIRRDKARFFLNKVPVCFFDALQITKLVNGAWFIIGCQMRSPGIADDWVTGIGF